MFSKKIQIKYLYLIVILVVIKILIVGCTSSSTYRNSKNRYPPAEVYYDDLTPSPTGSEIMLYALGLMDTKYIYGGKNPDVGLDCSGLVSHVYKNAADITLAGNAANQASKGRSISRRNLRAGDLIFFNTTGKPFSHVGIYVGNNRFIHAPNSRGVVRLESMKNRYWGSRIIAYRTYIN